MESDKPEFVPPENPRLEVIIRGEICHGKSTLAYLLKQCLAAEEVHEFVVVEDDNKPELMTKDKVLGALKLLSKHDELSITIRTEASPMRPLSKMRAAASALKTLATGVTDPGHKEDIEAFAGFVDELIAERLKLVAKW